MNKLFFALLFVALACSLCFAEEDAVSSASQQDYDTMITTTEGSSKALTFTGTISKMSSGTFLKKTNLEITAKDSSGSEATFILANNAVIIDDDGSKISSSWLSKNEKITIEYTEDMDGVKTAQSVKVLSSWQK